MESNIKIIEGEIIDQGGLMNQCELETEWRMIY